MEKKTPAVQWSHSLNLFDVLKTQLLGMPVRLITSTLLVIAERRGLGVVVQWHLIVMIVMRSKVRRSNTLVPASSLFDLGAATARIEIVSLTLWLRTPQTALVAAVVWVAAAGATADAEEPERSAGDAESHAEPIDDHDVLAQLQFDSVVFQGFVESFDEDGEEDGAGEDGAEGEEGREG